MEATPGKREQIATRIAFFVTGLSVASWAPLIPLVKAKLGLDEASLGALLLCLGLGSVIAMPMSGGLAAHFGCRKVILAAAVLPLCAMPLMALAPNVPTLAIALLLFGAGIGIMDVVMNIQAVIVEGSSGKTMMSGFHGMYSIGGIAGAGGVTGLLSLKLTPVASIAIIVATSALLMSIAAMGLLPYGTKEKSPPFAIPKGLVLLLGILCFALFLAEGAVLEWSGILLNNQHQVSKEQAGLGYAAFAATMTVGRFTGDQIVNKFGGQRVLFLGSLCAAFGFTLAAMVPSALVSIIGFALVGIGASNAVPVMFSAAGRQTVMPSNLALAGVTTMGYAGILVGPAAIGFLARQITLPYALLSVAATLVAVAMCAKAATRE